MRHDAPRPRRALRYVLLLSPLWMTAAPAWGQRVPLNPGDRIRVTMPDSLAGEWLEGDVLQATRIGVLLAPRDAAHDSVPVPLLSPVRLQVRRRSGLSVLLGTGIGMLVGGTAGAFIPEGTALWSDGRPGRLGEVAIGAAGGALIGWAATWFLGPKRWQEIPLSNRGILVAPLARTPRHRARFGQDERWRLFDPSEQDFAAFFWAHRDSLQPIEGIWRLQPRAVVDAQVAVVRDSRYEGWEYVAIRLPPRLRDRGPDDGTISFVARRADQPGVYEVRYVEMPAQSSLAVLDGAVLRIRLADTLEEWWKEPETPH